jgi:hypothetical protein
VSFCAVEGQWRGKAEVFDGEGRFLGHGLDRRHVVTDAENGRVRIDVSFSGPFALDGHYLVLNDGTQRIYEGPANVGLAERIGDDLVQADNYWTALGMSQRFFLMVLPGGQRQLSLALLSRGERLVYAVVGENEKVSCDAPAPESSRSPGLLHRPGVWRGMVGGARYEENIEAGDAVVRMRTAGGSVAPEPCAFELATDGTVAWTRGGQAAGSCSLFGGRAASGQLHYLNGRLRVWRREVVAHEGSTKVVLLNWYRGSQHLGTEHGVLRFEPR